MHDNSTKIMDDYVTVRLLVVLSGLGLSVTGAVLGFLWAEIVSNRHEISEVPSKIENALIEQSRVSFDQRARMWDRMNIMGDQINNVEKQQSRLEGRTDALIHSIDRAIERLEKLNEKVPERKTP